MIDAPGLTLVAQPSDSWKATGPQAGRIIDFAQKISQTLSQQGFVITPAAFAIHNAPPEHIGLGLGTQLGLAVARLICELAGIDRPGINELARLSGRGLRSGIGLHGFAHGGMVIDGGRARQDEIPPLLARLEFPGNWAALVVIPRRDPGLHGLNEIQAFASLPPSPDPLIDRLCRLVLLGLMPAVVERDLPRFGEALEEIQRKVGEGFAPAQGGTFARPEYEAILEAMRREGLRGVGQSSWGPTLYGFSDASDSNRVASLERLKNRLGLDSDSIFWTQASTSGASIIREDLP